jgi:hypothetical protein
MPAPTSAIKGEMLFQSNVQRSGWSEVYWLNQSNLQSALSALDALAAVRLTFLASAVTLLGYRITNPLVPAPAGYLRAQRSAYLAERNFQGSATGTGNGPMQSLAGVMLRLNNADLSIFKNQTYRGVPWNYWGPTQDAVARANYATWGPKWQAALIASAVCIRHATRQAIPFNFQQIQYVEYRRMDYRKAGRSFETLRGRR